MYNIYIPEILQSDEDDSDPEFTPVGNSEFKYLKKQANEIILEILCKQYTMFCQIH